MVSTPRISIGPAGCRWEALNPRCCLPAGSPLITINLPMECTGAEPSNQPLGTPHTIDLQTCHICLPRHVHPRPPAAKRHSILPPRLACGDANTDNPERLCDRPPKWGLGRTLAKTDRDATAGYRERHGGDGASHKQAQEDVRGPLRYLLPTRCATTRLQTPCGSTASRQ